MSVTLACRRLTGLWPGRLGRLGRGNRAGTGGRLWSMFRNWQAWDRAEDSPGAPALSTGHADGLGLRRAAFRRVESARRFGDGWSGRVATGVSSAPHGVEISFIGLRRAGRGISDSFWEAPCSGSSRRLRGTPMRAKDCVRETGCIDERALFADLPRCIDSDLSVWRNCDRRYHAEFCAERAVGGGGGISASSGD